MTTKKTFIIVSFLLLLTNKIQADARSWTAVGCGIVAQSALQLIYVACDAPEVDVARINIEIHRPVASNVVGLLTGLYIAHYNYNRIRNEKNKKRVK